MGRFFFLAAIASLGLAQDPPAGFQARLAQCDRAAAAFHVEMGRWLEGQGQLGWAKYQYEWALRLDPEGEAKGLLARAIEWTDRQTQTRPADPKGFQVRLTGIRKLPVDMPDGTKMTILLIDFRAKSKLDQILQIFGGVRHRKNGAILEHHSMISLRPKDEDEGSFEIHSTNPEYEHFKTAVLGDLELFNLRGRTLNLDYYKLQEEAEKRFWERGKEVGAGYWNLARESGGQDALVAARRCVIYDPGHREARLSLGHKKVEIDFETKDPSGFDYPYPRWSCAEELALRERIFERTKTVPQPGEVEDARGKMKERGLRFRTGSEWFCLYYWENTERSARIAKRCVQLINSVASVYFDWLGIRPEECFAEDADRRDKGPPGTGHLAEDPEELATMLTASLPIANLACSIFESKLQKAKGDVKPGWLAGGVGCLFEKLTTGYSDLYFTAESTKSFRPNDYDHPIGADWHAYMRRHVILGLDYPIDRVFGRDPGTYTKGMRLKAWSLVHYLALKHEAKFAEYLRALCNNKDMQGIRTFQEVFGWDLARLDREWRQFVLENY